MHTHLGTRAHISLRLAFSLAHAHDRTQATTYLGQNVDSINAQNYKEDLTQHTPIGEITFFVHLNTYAEA
jgi:hypothetical protein